MSVLFVIVVQQLIVSEAKVSGLSDMHIRS